MGEVADAIVHYEEALRLQPGVADAHAFLAHALTRLPERRSDAVVHYETALKLDPKLSWVHYNLAVALAEQPERLADAIVHCQAALHFNSDSAEVHNLLGVLQARRGRTEEAIGHWNRALEINSRFEPARRNLRLLEAIR
jgi:tetratricopeptide (TPR) repeat protein